MKKLIDDSYSFGTIITSDRRYSDIDIKHKRKVFEQYGINIIGVTRNPITGIDDNRGKQILDYLSSLKEEIDKIVILDDNDDGIFNFFEEEFILVNRFSGLNNSVYQVVL